MKRMKKLASLILAVIMVLSMTVAAFAEETNYTITVKHQEGTNVSLAGNTYNAYKLFDVTYDTDRDAYAYTLATEFEGFTYNEKSGKELIQYVETLGNDSEALNAFAESAFNYITENDITPKVSGEVAEGADSVVLNVGEPGYYLVSGMATTENGEKVIAACALSTAAPSTDVNVKADAPSLEKKIIENNVPVDANNASIGDTVFYQLTSKVPNMTGYEKYYFVVNDTLSSGLDFNPTASDPETEPDLQGNPEITIGDKKLVYGTDYTIEFSERANETDPTSFSIIFKNFIQYKEQAGDDIIINYHAVINGNAVIGSEGNDNVAKLQYSNNPNVTPDGDPENPDKPGPNDPKGETPEDRVITYVTGVELIKVDGANGDRLVGAEFEIKGDKINKIKVLKDTFEEDENGEYYKLADGKFTKDEPANENDDNYESTTVKYKKTQVVEWNETTEAVSATGTVGTDGVLRFDGLAGGTYTITEVVAPNGYNLLEEAITLTINCTEPEIVTDDNDTAIWKYNATGNGLNITDADLNTDGRIELSIANNKGTLLPSTGGIGTTIFYAAGIILMAGAVFFVVRRKKA